MVAIENQILWLSNQYHKEIFICEPLKEIQNENRNDQIYDLVLRLTTGEIEPGVA